MRANLCWMILPGEGSVQGQVGSQEGTLRWVFNRLQLTLYGHLVVEVRAAGAETGKVTLMSFFIAPTCCQHHSHASSHINSSTYYKVDLFAQIF